MNKAKTYPLKSLYLLKLLKLTLMWKV